MRDFVDKCVILKVNDYRDDDRLAKTLTAEHGLVSVLFKGVKKAKAKLKPFAQPFAVFDARLISGRGAFLTPVEPLLVNDGFSLCSDLRKFTASGVAAEATVAAIGDDEAHPLIFRGARAADKSVGVRRETRTIKRRCTCASCCGFADFIASITRRQSRERPYKCLGLRSKTDTASMRTSKRTAICVGARSNT